MTMMKCGHSANAKHEGKPCCAICAEILPQAYVVDEEPPDLAEREARCSCGKTMPSNDKNLAFFEYRGEGSQVSFNCKVCGFSIVAHNKERTHYKTLQKCVDEDTYTPRGGMEYDSFYCGHSGWD
jgi:hypothetical protein